MNKPILGMAIILAAASAVCAQQANNASSAGRTAENSPAVFSDTSAAQVNLFEASASESRSFALATPAADPAPVPAAPAPKPNFIYGNPDHYRWQLSLPVSVYPFHSTILTPPLLSPP